MRREKKAVLTTDSQEKYNNKNFRYAFFFSSQTEKSEICYQEKQNVSRRRSDINIYAVYLYTCHKTVIIWKKRKFFLLITIMRLRLILIAGMYLYKYFIKSFFRYFELGVFLLRLYVAIQFSWCLLILHCYLDMFEN